MRKTRSTTGGVMIKKPHVGGQYICAIEMTGDEGFSCVIDLTPRAARELGLALLNRSGAVNSIDATREVVLGARH